MTAGILLINGPNLNLLGTREPEKYGTTTLAQIEADCKKLVASKAGDESLLSTFQSNHEGAIVDRIHKAREEGVGFIVINAGAFTHYSVALRDALAGVNIPFIELHITNVHSREPFRHKSFLADIAVAVVSGLGVYGYEASISYAINTVTK